MVATRITRLLLAGTFLVATLFLLYRQYQPERFPASPRATTIPRKKYPLKKFRNIFAFGDSLSSTNFNTEVDMPTAANPFGNVYPGLTSSGGPNWLGSLIHDHMKQTLLFNFAQGGSHINSSEFHDPNPAHYDFTTQVDNFLLKVETGEGLPDWEPENTLFVAWLGTNDVYGAFVRKLGDEVFDEFLGMYFAQLDRLRDVGGVTFLGLTPQPLHHVRLHNFGNPLDKQLEYLVHSWNEKFSVYANEWEKGTGARLEIVDVTTMVEDAIEKKVAEPCSSLEDNRGHEECMWEDKFHLGVKPHRMIAQAVVDIFEGRAS